VDMTARSTLSVPAGAIQPVCERGNQDCGYTSVDIRIGLFRFSNLTTNINSALWADPYITVSPSLDVSSSYVSLPADRVAEFGYVLCSSVLSCIV
jgi:hypothetical protein